MVLGPEGVAEGALSAQPAPWRWSGVRRPRLEPREESALPSGPPLRGRPAVRPGRPLGVPGTVAQAAAPPARAGVRRGDRRPTLRPHLQSRGRRAARLTQSGRAAEARGDVVLAVGG